MLSALAFLAAKIFPWWSIPLGAVFVQIGIHHRRRRRPVQWLYFSIAGAFFLAALAWIVFRGDFRAEVWVRSIIG